MTFLNLIGMQESLHLAQPNVRHVTRLFLLLKRVWPARLQVAVTSCQKTTPVSYLLGVVKLVLLYVDLSFASFADPWRGLEYQESTP